MLKPKSTILFLTLLAILQNGYCQQDPYLSHYMFNKAQFNPGYTGNSGMLCLSGIYHNQWAGLKDYTSEYNSNGQNKQVSSVGPSTTGVTIEAPVYFRNGPISLGIGASIIQDNLGYENTLKARGLLALRYTTRGGSKIALGAELGMMQKGLDGNELLFLDPFDPNIPNGSVSANKFNTALGIYYFNPSINNFYLGYSSTNILKPRFNYPGGKITNMAAVHHYIMSGAKLKAEVRNSRWSFSPSLLIKISSKTQATLSGLIERNNMLSGGLAFRSGADAATILFGYKPQENLRIGYSYDFTLNALHAYSNGTHEIQINYCFLSPEKRTKELCPRHLDEHPQMDFVKQKYLPF